MREPRRDRASIDGPRHRNAWREPNLELDAGSESADESPIRRPRLLLIDQTDEGAAIISSDGARCYFTDWDWASAYVQQLVQPALNVEPRGNC
jgi:hypothetical protein